MITVYGAKTSLDELNTVPVIRPEKAGCRWRGVKHAHVLKTVISSAEKRGWGVNDLQICLAKDNEDMVAAIDLKVPDILMPEGQSLSLGVVTSNAMRKALRLLVGASIAVCHNGMATGEIILHKKHTMNFDIFEEIPIAMDKYEGIAKEIPLLVERLQHRELREFEAEAIMFEAGRRKLLPWNEIAKVDHEYHHPTFSDHGQTTSWALLNAFTYIVRKRAPLGQMDRQLRFKNLLPLYTAT